MQSCTYIFLLFLHQKTFPLYRFGFLDDDVNIFRGFGYDCTGKESVLTDCALSGSVCVAESEEHAIAISCGGSDTAGILYVHQHLIDLEP